MSSLKTIGKDLGFAAGLLVSVALAPSALADDVSEASAAEWLQRMNSVFTELNYDGVFSFISGTDLASLRIVHMVEDGVQNERLIHLNGAPREIVREGEKVLCIMGPEDKLLDLGSSIPAGPFAKAFVRNFDDVDRNYHLEMAGEDRVAGRVSVRLDVKPKDENRYGYRLWLDKQTGLLLRSDLVDEVANKSLEVFQFNQLTVGAGVQKAALKSEQSGEAVVHQFEIDQKVKAEGKDHPNGWHATWLPDGFEMAASDVREMAATTTPVNTMMYTDGLAAISVFVEEAHDDDEMGHMVAQHGATVSVTEIVEDPDGTEHVVTVVGEIPPKTAAAIAESVKFSR